MAENSDCPKKSLVPNLSWGLAIPGEKYRLIKFCNGLSMPQEYGKTSSHSRYNSKLRVIKTIYTSPGTTVYIAKLGNQTCIAKKYISSEAEEFKAERDILNTLNHKNIISLVPVNFKKTLILEYHGTDLRCVLKKGKFSNTISIIRQILLALIYLHERSLVHCDVKPENILVDSEGVVKLIDFASARMAGSEAKNLRNTICYSSLEVLLGTTSIEPSIDMWAFGCVVYELALGKQPFNGSNTFSVINQILNLLGSPKREDYIKTELRHINFVNVFTGAEPSIKLSAVESYGIILAGLFAFNPTERITSTAALSIVDRLGS